MNGADRLAWADAHEQAVMSELRGRGLAVDRFGQALLPPPIRNVMKGSTSLLRWLPDLACWHPTARHLALIDAKGSIGSKTENHAIELRSILAARITGLPVFYVCDEMKALLATQIVRAGGCCDGCWERMQDDPWGRRLPVRCPEHERRGGAGSGTPYVLVSRKWCQPLSRALAGYVTPPPAVHRRASLGTV